MVPKSRFSTPIFGHSAGSINWTGPIANGSERRRSGKIPWKTDFDTEVILSPCEKFAAEFSASVPVVHKIPLLGMGSKSEWTTASQPQIASDSLNRRGNRKDFLQ